jgi:FixJ family two-component response regulator
MQPTFPVHVVDDDLSVRRSLERTLRLNGWLVRTYATVTEFEASDAAAFPGCLLLDLRLPEVSGLDLLAKLEQAGTPLGVVLVSGFGDVQSTVRAMRLGALDVLTKPFDDSALMQAVERAFAKSALVWQERSEIVTLRQRVNRLTPRELQVGQLVVTGMMNKEIAAALGTSIKTVKVHRARVMRKLGATSIPHLVRVLDRVSG